MKDTIISYELIISLSSLQWDFKSGYNYGILLKNFWPHSNYFPSMFRVMTVSGLSYFPFGNVGHHQESWNMLWGGGRRVAVEKATVGYLSTHFSVKHRGIYPRDAWEPTRGRIKFFTKQNTHFPCSLSQKILNSWMGLALTSRSMWLRSRWGRNVRP